MDSRADSVLGAALDQETALASSGMTTFMLQVLTQRATPLAGLGAGEDDAVGRLDRVGQSVDCAQKWIQTTTHIRR